MQERRLNIRNTNNVHHHNQEEAAATPRDPPPRIVGGVREQPVFMFEYSDADTAMNRLLINGSDKRRIEAILLGL